MVNDVVTGWKEIAATLCVSVPTAKEWRIRSGLPVVNLSSRCVASTRTALQTWAADRHSTLSRRVADALGLGVREGGQ